MRLFLSPCADRARAASPSLRRRLSISVPMLLLEVRARSVRSGASGFPSSGSAPRAGCCGCRRRLPGACVTPRDRCAASRPTCGRSVSRARSPSPRAGTSAARPGARVRWAGPSRSTASERHRLLRQLAVLARDLLGLLLRRLHVALAARALLLLEPALRLAQLAERRAGLARRCSDLRTMPRAASRRRPAARPARPARDRDDCARATGARAGARPLRPARRARAGWRRHPGRPGRRAPAAAGAPLPAAAGARARAAFPSARRPADPTAAAARSARSRTGSRACRGPA